jgi:hypothetical protein
VAAYVATWRQPGGDDRGDIQVIGQRIHVGMGHAGRTVTDRRARLRDERQIDKTGAVDRP